jgi:flagellar biosynthesis chaperone FliJ
MSSSPKWLSTLQDIREHRRDVARHFLAQSLQASAKIGAAINGVAEEILILSQAQQQSVRAGRLDAERLLQMRQDRDTLRSQLAELGQQQSVAGIALHEAQSFVADQDAEVDVLRRLSERLDSAQRQAQRRQEEQTATEIAVSLCNGQLSD